MGEVDWQSATMLVLAGRQSMRRSGTIAQELLKSQPVDERGGLAERDDAGTRKASVDAAIRDDRTRIVES